MLCAKAWLALLCMSARLAAGDQSELAASELIAPTTDLPQPVAQAGEARGRPPITPASAKDQQAASDGNWA